MLYKLEREEVELNLPWWKRMLGALFQYPRWQATWANFTFEIDIDVEPYIPACVSGLPEDCYPAEGGGIDGWGVTLIDADFIDKDGDLLVDYGDLKEAERCRIENGIDAEIAEMGDLYQNLMDHAAEADEPDHDLMEDYW